MDKNELEIKVDEILKRGVLTDFFPTKKRFREKLLSGKKLRFYIGVDPTAKALHLGHAQNLMILEDFRCLGHEVIFLIGDFTAMIGDPTDKDSVRVKQTSDQVEENLKGWLGQVKNILSFDDEDNPVQVKYNSDWLSKMKFGEVIDLASNFTVQQMLERDMFEKRLYGEVYCKKCKKSCIAKPTEKFLYGKTKPGKVNIYDTRVRDVSMCPFCGEKYSNLRPSSRKPIYLHEFFYPLMQGYDSVKMNVDVEICGTDQIFNALMGRALLKKIKNKEKFVIAAKLIQNERTGILMSKSNGTGVFLDLKSKDLFGAIMAQSDGMIKPLLLGCTRISNDEIKKLMSLDNPRDAKLKLAEEIVKIYHGKEKAQKAKEYFISTFSEKKIPEDVRVEYSKVPEILIVDYMLEAGLAESKSDARRKIEQGGVSIDGEKITDTNKILNKSFSDKVIKVGKKDFVKIVF